MNSDRLSAETMRQDVNFQFTLSHAGLSIAKNIVVSYPEGVDAWKPVPNAFIPIVLREGIMLYEAYLHRGGC